MSKDIEDELVNLRKFFDNKKKLLKLEYEQQINALEKEYTINEEQLLTKLYNYASEYIKEDTPSLFIYSDKQSNMSLPYSFYKDYIRTIIQTESENKGFTYIQFWLEEKKLEFYTESFPFDEDFTIKVSNTTIEDIVDIIKNNIYSMLWAREADKKFIFNKHIESIKKDMQLHSNPRFLVVTVDSRCFDLTWDIN
jgi:hypothetical protein